MITSDPSEVKFWSQQHRRSQPLVPKPCIYSSNVALNRSPLAPDSLRAEMHNMCSFLYTCIQNPPPGVCKFSTKCAGAVFLYRDSASQSVQFLATVQPRELDESAAGRGRGEANWCPMFGCIQGKVFTDRQNHSLASECFCQALFREINEEIGLNVFDVVAELAADGLSELDIIRPITINTAWETTYCVFMCSETFAIKAQDSHRRMLESPHVFTSWPEFQLAVKDRRRSSRTPVFAEVLSLSSIPWSAVQQYCERYSSISEFHQFDVPRAVDGISPDRPFYKLFVEILIKLRPSIQQYINSL
jgi:hypothetical protein